MQVPGRTRLLLVDAPAILTRKELEEIDAANGERTLKDGLRLAQQQGAIRMLPLNELSYVLSGAYDRGALAIEAGARSEDVEAVIEAIVSGLRS